jgi:sirohydrochlorin ferrochelatase
MTLRRSYLERRLRLPLAAAATLVPDLPRDSQTALDATLVLPGGVEHSTELAWTGRAERYCFVSGRGWHTVCSALDLQDGHVIDIAREQGDALRLHITTAGLSDGAAAGQTEAAMQTQSAVMEPEEDTPAADR